MKGICVFFIFIICLKIQNTLSLGTRVFDTVRPGPTLQWRGIGLVWDDRLGWPVGLPAGGRRLCPRASPPLLLLPVCNACSPAWQRKAICLPGPRPRPKALFGLH